MFYVLWVYVTMNFLGFFLCVCVMHLWMSSCSPVCNSVYMWVYVWGLEVWGWFLMFSLMAPYLIHEGSFSLEPRAPQYTESLQLALRTHTGPFLFSLQESRHAHLAIAWYGDPNSGLQACCLHSKHFIGGPSPDPCYCDFSDAVLLCTVCLKWSCVMSLKSMKKKEKAWDFL